MRKWLAISALVMLSDIISKHYIKKLWVLGEHKAINPFF